MTFHCFTQAYSQTIYNDFYTHLKRYKYVEFSFTQTLVNCVDSSVARGDKFMAVMIRSDKKRDYDYLLFEDTDHSIFVSNGPHSILSDTSLKRVIKETESGKDSIYHRSRKRSHILPLIWNCYFHEKTVGNTAPSESFEDGEWVYRWTTLYGRDTVRFVFRITPDLQPTLYSVEIVSAYYRCTQYDEYRIHSFTTREHSDTIMNAWTLLNEINSTEANKPYVTPKLDEKLTGLDFPLDSGVDVNGEVVPLKAQDSLLLLDFWYMGCGPCIEAVPAMDSLRKAFHSLPVKFASVNFHDSASARVKRYADKYGFYNPVFLTASAGHPFLRQIFSFPLFMLISGDKIVFISNGYNDKTYAALYDSIHKQLSLADKPK